MLIYLYVLVAAMGLMGIGTVAFMAAQDYDEVMGTFKHSRFVWYYGGPPAKDSYLRRYVSMLNYCGVLGWPGRYIANGMLEPGEFASLAVSVRRRMRYAKWSLTFFFAGTVLVCLLFANDFTQRMPYE
ncbi:hypothetical protein ACIP1T_25975 [Pseudomonas japonica]|uniref:hypothetical protein n=1 Tax=Pseudomonas japonica TaxID=256466 RepID=UPI00382676C6